MGRKTVIIGIIVILLAGVGYTSYRVIQHLVTTNPRQAMKANAPMPVKTAQAQIRTITDIIGASGHSQEFSSVMLTAQISQPVMKVHISLGQQVAQGQLLISFEQTVVSAKVNEALERVSKAELDLKNRRNHQQRLESLYSQQLIAKIELERANEDVQAARLSYANANVLLEEAKQDLEATTVKSPVSGIILELPINAGETPRTDTPLVKIGLIDTIFMKAQLAESKLSFIHINQEAEMSFDSFRNETFKGILAKIDPNVNPLTRTFTVFLKIENSDHKLTPGLSGFIRIKNTKTALAVPSVSIVNPVGEQASVFTIDANRRAIIRKVKTGIASGGYTEISDGLSEGEQVITAGMQFLKGNEIISEMD